MNKKIILVPILASCLFGCKNATPPTNDAINGDVNTSENDLNNKVLPTELQNYDIYPIVQTLIYKENNSWLTDKINIVSEAGIDVYTTSFAKELILEKGKNFEVTNSLSNKNTNLVLGLYGKHGLAESQFSNKETSFIPNHFDSYILDLSPNKITILGKNTDAVYYGLTSLEYIFEQCANDYYTNLRINDYAQSQYRGFIEGFYGLPWSSEQRIHLMNLSHRAKANIYIYAPKNDVYHSTKWRDLYEGEALKNLTREIQAGKENKIKFAWAIHPFQHSPITTSNYNSALTAVKNKFDQVYNAGCRQFIVCADDVSLASGVQATASLHKQLMNDLVVWNNSKRDCADLTIVPTGYNSRSSYKADTYLPALCNGLSSDVHIMWTGSDVFSNMSTMDFNKFSSYTSGRKPFIWMNWGVNDGWPEYLMMGSGESVYDVKYTNDSQISFDGMVCNPIVEAEPALFNIWETCCYCWNTKDYDAKTNIDFGYRLFEPNQYENFKYIVDILNTDKDDCFKKKNEEASLLRKVSEPFLAKYNADEDFSDELLALKTYFLNLRKACNEYNLGASNIALKNQLKPWTNSIIFYADIALRSIAMIESKNDNTTKKINDFIYNVNQDMTAIGYEKTKFVNISTSLEEIKQVLVGRYYFAPFISSLYSIALDQNSNAFVKENKAREVTYGGFYSLYEGMPYNISDGNESTYCWFGNIPVENSFINVDLGESKIINNVYVSFGTSTGKDKFLCDVEISGDGVHWSKCGTITNDESFKYTFAVSGSPSARFVRLVSHQTNSTWVAVKEISVNH